MGAARLCGRVSPEFVGSCSSMMPGKDTGGGSTTQNLMCKSAVTDSYELSK